MQVSIREFKARLSSYLNQAQAGEPLEITSHRKVVARVIGVSSSDTGLNRLTSSGAATWAGGKPQGSCLQLKTKGATLSQMVLEDRA
jgi:prevent-host-death family protein